MATFKIESSFQPQGDQPQAIQSLVKSLREHNRNQVLLGVTGSGKTFTIANVIQELQRPTLVLAPNKTLAAQLYGEMKEFFPNNTVEYFVSYYDYYQPEAYVPRTDTYIEKEASINEQLDRMRHAATRALLEKDDAIIIASVSCIYGIGGVETYSGMVIPINKGLEITPQNLSRKLSEIQYKRNDFMLQRGTFRIKGDIFEIFPPHLDDRAWRLSFFGDEIESVQEIDPLTGEIMTVLEQVKVYPNSHYVTPTPTIHQAIKHIQADLQERLKEFEETGKLLEAQRLRERVTFDIEMLQSTSFCSGIENYSRYLTGRPPGSAPPTLFEYLPKDGLLVVDESHISVPQLSAMYKGDASRKNTLSEHGFRLPACKDNRPLKFEEWDELRPQTVFVSATPGPWEMAQTQGEYVEQVIRPTGLLDPICEIRPTKDQVDDLIAECLKRAKKQERVLVTTLTKKMAEALTEYMLEAGLKVRYIHSDVDTLERIEIIRDLRLGIFDVLIGINLLREGLDIPECSLVAILDADKEGYLRSKTSLIQTIGRAARNLYGIAILYADRMTKSMDAALEEANRRRHKQEAYNQEHGLTPASIQKRIQDIGGQIYAGKEAERKAKQESLLTPKQAEKKIDSLRKQMLKAASDLNFEQAASIRDQIKEIEQNVLRV
jgi:excinuclease ABC subunit B